MNDIKVEIITPADTAAVVDHLSRHFCLDEPILNSLDLDPDLGFLQMCSGMIKHGISLKAVNENGEIVGLFLSEFKERNVSDLCMSQIIYMFNFQNRIRSMK